MRVLLFFMAFGWLPVAAVPAHQFAPGVASQARDNVIAQWSGLWRVEGDPRSADQPVHLRLFADGLAQTQANEDTVGSWEVEGGLEMRAIVASFGDGWKYRILPTGEGFGVAIQAPGKETVTGTASRVGNLRARYAGAWRIQNTDTKRSFYLLLSENGGAASSLAPGRTDFWWVARGAAHIRLPDGEHALLFPRPDGEGWDYAHFPAGSEEPVVWDALRVDKWEPRFAGVWSIVEPSGGGVIRLLPGGGAVQSGRYSRVGVWTVHSGEAWIEWDGGGRAVLVSSPEGGFTAWFWQPGQLMSDAPEIRATVVKTGL